MIELKCSLSACETQNNYSLPVQLAYEQLWWFNVEVGAQHKVLHIH